MKTMKDWIQVRSGGKFFPLDPDPDAIDIQDIAHALSNICRYTGHVSEFYSVAEHSCYVSRQLPSEHALAGLLHDAAEAYMNDVASPVKHQDAMQPYRDAEKKLERMILTKYGLAPELPPEVKVVDLKMLSTEAHTLLAPLHPEWTMTVDGGALPEPYPFQVQALSPHQAKEWFLDRFNMLTNGGR